MAGGRSLPYALVYVNTTANKHEILILYVGTETKRQCSRRVMFAFIYMRETEEFYLELLKLYAIKIVNVFGHHISP